MRKMTRWDFDELELMIDTKVWSMVPRVWNLATDSPKCKCPLQLELIFRYTLPSPNVQAMRCKPIPNENNTTTCLFSSICEKFQIRQETTTDQERGGFHERSE